MKFAVVLNSNNVHLTKDVGLILYGMSKYYNYDCSILTYDIYGRDEDGYENLKYIPGVHLDFIKKRTGHFDVDVFFYILRNASFIDILNIYHMRTASVLAFLYYKLRNPKKKVFFKCDGGYRKDSLKKWQQKMFGYMMRHCDLISVESIKKQTELIESWERILGKFNLKSKNKHIDKFANSGGGV